MATRKRTTKKVVQEVTDGEIIAAAEVEKPAKSDTVCVCLNFPFDVKYMVPDNSGKMVEIVFKGNGTALKGLPKGVLPAGGAYGITTDVPREAWEYIVKHRPKDPLILKGNLFSCSAKQARAAIAERNAVRHGFEPINTKK